MAPPNTPPGLSPTAWAVLVALCGLMALLAVFNQVKAQGLSWQEGYYTGLLRAGDDAAVAKYPERSARLSFAVTKAAVALFESLGLPRGLGVALVGLRLLQTLAVMLLALRFYQWLGIHTPLALLGLMGLSWSMTHGHAAGPLAVESYTMLLVALAAGIALCRASWPALGAVALLAAAEGGVTAILPPLLCLAWLCAAPAPSRLRSSLAGFRWAAVACLVLAAGIGCGSLAAAWGAVAGGARAQLAENLSSLSVAVRVGMALGLLPVLAGLGRPTVQFVFAFVFVFFWIFVCLLAGPLTETHRLLVPEVLVLIPAMLRVVQDAQCETTGERVAA